MTPAGLAIIMFREHFARHMRLTFFDWLRDCVPVRWLRPANDNSEYGTIMR